MPVVVRLIIAFLSVTEPHIYIYKLRWRFHYTPGLSAWQLLYVVFKAHVIYMYMKHTFSMQLSSKPVWSIHVMCIT